MVLSGGVAKAFYERRSVGLAAQRECRQAHHRNPPVRPCFQRGGGPVFQILPQDACEKGLRLRECKAQVGSAQFAQVSIGAPPGQRKRRIGTCRKHQVQLERLLLDQLHKQGVDLARVDEVIVIQHQHDVAWRIGQVREEQVRHAPRLRELRSDEEAGGSLERIGKDASQGSRQRMDEEAQVVFLIIQGEPGAGSIECPHPLGQKRRLTKAGRGAYQGDDATETCVQSLEKVRA
jgi:hypothetical protein